MILKLGVLLQSPSLFLTRVEMALAVVARVPMAVDYWV
jgi:hypothetical protein